MDFPVSVQRTLLFSKLSEDNDLLSAIKSLRSTVSALADTTSRSVPHFTDHTVRHMDSLWRIGEEVLTSDEIQALTTAEIFLLAAGFYLHDAGMAYTATEAGLLRIMQSNEYKGYISRLAPEQRSDPDQIAQALAATVRKLHATAAKELAQFEIPGTEDRYLFEPRAIRDEWAATAGDIATSHHWPMSKLESFFGMEGSSPLPGGRTGDLLFVAICLRIIDYAHINRERALQIDRAFRGRLSADSIVHWLAQEHIDGPSREHDELVYRAANPISDIDAWWLYYEMLTGLDFEIRSARRLLDRRRDNLKKLSLVGVRGVDSPEIASKLIPTSGFLPIEVSLRTGSLDRLVELLAGETLYGPNPMAAVRELIQNARDAVRLKSRLINSEADRALAALPITVSLKTSADRTTFEITDHGVGMSRTVMTDYLISIASDYWDSQFAADFPDVAEAGFDNAGKFGIGFLSCFMLGNEVEIESNRSGGDRHRLTLRGVGRRGELRQVASTGASGTNIKITLKPGMESQFSQFRERVAAYAPTLPHDLVVAVGDDRHQFPSGWLRNLPPGDFVEWLTKSASFFADRNIPYRSISYSVVESALPLLWSKMGHIEQVDLEKLWPEGAPEYITGSTRLIAHPTGVSILCVRGLAVQTIATQGFCGVIDLDRVELEASRNRTIDADVNPILNEAKRKISTQITKNLNAIKHRGLLISMNSFIARCVSDYGRDGLMNSTYPWASQLSYPGNVELIDSTTLLSRAASADSIFFGFGMGPWNCMKEWERLNPSESEISILIDSNGQPTPDYLTSNESPRTGSISLLWPRWERAPLLSLAINTIAQAWQQSPTSLVEQVWNHTNQTLFVRLKRYEQN